MNKEKLISSSIERNALAQFLLRVSLYFLIAVEKISVVLVQNLNKMLFHKTCDHLQLWMRKKNPKFWKEFCFEKLT